MTSVRLKTRKTRLAKLIILCSYPCSQLCSSLLFYQFAEEEREKWLKIFSPSVLSFLGTRHWSLCGLRDTLNNDSKYWRQKLGKFYDYTTFPMWYESSKNPGNVGGFRFYQPNLVSKVSPFRCNCTEHAESVGISTCKNMKKSPLHHFFFGLLSCCLSPFFTLEFYILYHLDLKKPWHLDPSLRGSLQKHWESASSGKSNRETWKARLIHGKHNAEGKAHLACYRMKGS